MTCPAPPERIGAEKAPERGKSLLTQPMRLPGGLPLQKKCACGRNAGASGTCEQCRHKAERLQRKAVDTRALGENSLAEEGRYEAEADRVADQILSPCSASATNPIQPQSARPSIQRLGADAHAAPGNVPAAVTSALSSPGAPLGADSRQFFESRFGHDFSRVRIHVDDAAVDSVAAQAFTVGERIVFGANRFQPSSDAGRRLLAHELTHVVQQTGHPGPSPASGATMQKKGGLLSPEKVAEVYGAWVIELSRARHTGVLASSTVDADARARTKKQVGPANFANWERWEEGKQQAAEAKADADNPKEPSEPFDPEAQSQKRYAELKGLALALGKEVARVEHQAASLNFGSGFGGTVSRVTAGGYTAMWGIGGRAVSSAVEHGPMLLLEGAGTALGSEYAERKLVEEGRAIRKEGQEMGEDARTGVRLTGGELQENYNKTRPSYNQFMAAQTAFFDASSEYLRKADRGYLEQAQFLGNMDAALKDMRAAADDYLMTCARLGIENDAGSLRTLGDHIVKGSEQVVSTAVTTALPEVAPGLGELADSAKSLKGSGARQLEKELASSVEGAAKKEVTQTAGTALKKEASQGTRGAIKGSEESALGSGSPSTVKSAEGAGAKSTPGGSEIKTQSDAIQFVDEHPPGQIEGQPGSRHAKVEGHEIVEVPGGCELHSPPPYLKVPCPWAKRKPFSEDPNFHRDLMDEPGNLHGEGQASQAHEHPADVPEDRPSDLFDKTQQEIDDAVAARERGNTFNTEREPHHAHNEVDVDSVHPEDVVTKGPRKGQPKRFRLDSYDPGRGIVSRKYPQGQVFDAETATKYIAELADKYPPGAVISQTPKNQAAKIAGQTLRGQPILEVPVLLKDVPREVLEFADRQGVQIVDTAGRIYNHGPR